MKHVLLTGASGFLGSWVQQVEHASWEIIPVHRGMGLDLTDTAGLAVFLQKAQPDAIIHLAAQANANFCEKEPEAAWAINAGTSAQLAEYAVQHKIPLLYTSTDLVFDGKKAPYAPDAPVNPINVYGNQKAEAEKRILSIYPQATIARMPLMYGAFTQTQHFMAQWRLQLLQNQPLKAFVDEFRTPAFAEDAAAGLWLLLDQGATGIWHLGGPERSSRYHFASLLAEVLGVDSDLVQASRQADLPMAANRPADVSLDSSAAFTLGYVARGVREGLAAAIQTMDEMD
jgi:dTDP-4-dehydrorhamnose reductase